MINVLKKNQLLLSLIVLATLYACNSGDKKNAESTESTATTASSPTTETTPSTSAKAAALTGYLDTLWITADSFKTLPNKKVVFSFAFRDPDTLTLYGWYCRGVICVGSYDNQDRPDVGLTKGHQSPVAYGPNVTFGNIILSDVKKIKNMIGTKYRYVVFAPERYGDFIKYVIYLSNDDPALIKVLALDPTGVEANPSPPKSY